jgi:diguanylate cyclase (GGDEF)-like protein
LLGDLAFALTEITGALPKPLGEVLTCAGWALVPAGLVHPSIATLTSPVDAPPAALDARRIGVLAGASLLPPAALAGQALSGQPVSALPVAGISSVLVLLVLARMAELVQRIRRQAAELEHLSSTDPLTGAANRRAWDAALADAAARAQRSAAPLSVAMLDLDHFKRFNDSRGHGAGDVLLRTAVTAWQEGIRATDVLARLGGEEFGVLLPECTAGDAVALVERLCTLVPDGQTCSAGVAVWDAQEPLDELLARADAGLYASKHAGRARTTLAEADGRYQRA